MIVTIRYPGDRHTVVRNFRSFAEAEDTLRHIGRSELIPQLQVRCTGGCGKTFPTTASSYVCDDCFAYLTATGLEQIGNRDMILTVLSLSNRQQI